MNYPFKRALISRAQLFLFNCILLVKYYWKNCPRYINKNNSNKEQRWKKWHKQSFTSIRIHVQILTQFKYNFTQNEEPNKHFDDWQNKRLFKNIVINSKSSILWMIRLLLLLVLCLPNTQFQSMHWTKIEWAKVYNEKKNEEASVCHKSVWRHFGFN